MTAAAKSGPRMSRTGPLVVLAVLLFASGLLRLGGGTGRAIALEVGALGSPAMESNALTTPSDLSAAIDALRAREERLAAREAAAADRAKALEVAEVAVRQNLALLAAAEDRLSLMVTEIRAAAEGDLAQLTAVYENMKPKEAALLFEQMSPEFAAGFLGRMRPDAAAVVMAGLKPETAYSISVLLAGRNAEAAALVADE